MRRIRSIWLVARREILERGRSRGYLLSLAFTILLLGASFALPILLIGDRDTLRIGVVGTEPQGLRPALAAVAQPFDATVDVAPYPDLDAAERALTEGALDAVLDLPPDLSGPGRLIVRERADDRLRVVTASAVVAIRQQRLLQGAGVDPAEFAAVSQPPAIDALDPPNESDGSVILFANAGIILMFVGILSYGTWVLMGVVEEKQSRVVEVVLSTVRPRDLLMGKVLGIGVLALGQLVVLVAVGLAAAHVTGALMLPETIPVTVVFFLFWFILGFALYATALGFLGSLATRMEEASNATTPVTMVFMLCYFAAFFVAQSDPAGTLATVMTFFPPAAPIVVPLRTALGAIGPLELVASIVVSIVFIAILFELGARIYSGAVLQTGGRIRLRDAWRLSR